MTTKPTDQRTKLPDDTDVLVRVPEFRAWRWRRTLAMVPAAIGLAGLLTGCPNAPPGLETADVALQLVAEGFVSPVGMVAANDGSGRLFILDQAGTVSIIDADGNLKTTPFLDLSDRIVELMPDFDERGLLGLAFHPDYATNGRFFVFYTAPKGPETPAEFDSQTHISEFQVSAADPDQADPTSERVLLTIDKPQFNHNGGQLAFGSEGYLYVAVGDGGGANDTDAGHTPDLGNGQDKSTLLGKVLRIAVAPGTGVDGGDPYAIPPDNPFLDDAAARPEIWAMGFRNPWRFSFDMGGEHRLFLGDAGQDVFEEVHIVDRGENYGWNIKEGAHCFDPDSPGSPPATCADVDVDGNPLVDPIIEYSHLDADGEPFGVVVIGGYVYRGSTLPELQGQYIFGDYSSGFTAPDGRLLAATEAADGSWTMRELSVASTANGRPGRFILGFGQDTEGEVYVLTTQVVGPNGTTGRVLKLVPAS